MTNNRNSINLNIFDKRQVKNRINKIIYLSWEGFIFPMACLEKSFSYQKVSGKKGTKSQIIILIFADSFFLFKVKKNGP